MNQQLPPFSWLQAFEATARNSSFTRAALALGITQAAISPRIRNLEELVGTKLFVRDGNSVSLTSAAHEFLISIRAVIDEVRLATDRVSHHDRGESAAVMPCRSQSCPSRCRPLNRCLIATAAVVGALSRSGIRTATVGLAVICWRTMTGYGQFCSMA